MTVNIWLDDKFSPKPDPDYIAEEYRVTDWVHVRNRRELEELLESTAEPIGVMSFDHNLGPGEPTGHDIIKWLAEQLIYEGRRNRWPREVRVHSGNWVGADNIRAYAEFINKNQSLWDEGVL